MPRTQLAAVLLLSSVFGSFGAAPPERFTPKISDFVNTFKPGGALSDGSAKPTPEESLAAFKLADGITVDAPLHEPEVRQPLNLNFDERGRLWIVQYLQYPFPAGLKITHYDKYLRAVFDKTPPPPPRHSRGRDKITIHEDTDGDGQFDTHKTFLDGLNMARSVVSGRGGVWVLMPPYLLFYPDANRDDIPDGDPVVKLEGFGLEDTHSGANSLRWGPDGWLYGAHGSTCTADVKGVQFLGQAIWRYHPEADRFEVFAEGGGNTYSLEFDSKGRTFSGTNHGKTRGVHYPQGGAFIKNWGKHGPLMNPYSFGWFEHMKHEGYAPRFAQTIIIYEGGAIPQLEGDLIAGMALTSRVQASRFSRDTSSFETVDTDILIDSASRWFRPVDTKAGPDGAIYIADWCDSRLSHLDPRDNWDKESGRVYRIRAEGASGIKTPDLGSFSNARLVEQLSHPNKWRRQTALRILHDRKPAHLQTELARNLFATSGQLALESLWALNAAGGFTKEIASRALEHANPMVRYWALRLVGDSTQSVAPIRHLLVDRARYETDPEVRTQLASTARRLPAVYALPILDVMLRSEPDAKDVHLPLLIWWALENKAIANADAIVEMLEDPELWKKPLLRETVASRLARRYCAERTPSNLNTAARLLTLAERLDATDLILNGMDEGLSGDPVDQVPGALTAAIAKLWSSRQHDARLVRVAARLNYPPAIDEAIGMLKPGQGSASARRDIIELLAEKREPKAVPVLMELLKTESSAKPQIELISALRRFSTTRVASLLLERLPKLHNTARSTAISALASRLEWSQLLLEAVDADAIRAEWITIPHLIAIQEFGCDHCNGMIRKHWGQLRQSNEEKEAEVKKIRNVLQSGKGDAKSGEQLFTLLCGTCHRLGKIGGRIGPDLTGYERDNLDFIVPAIVDPSLAIREEFTPFNLIARDGQTLTGFLVRNDTASVELKDASGNTQTIPRREIVDLTATQTSLMPEGLLSALNDQQIRDLFAFFTSAQAK
ncbi:MAG: c-type cytochrome [Verrucomicrobiae bacterium]|nr:c-type cytochrome [Verrucomicrobiae bacterium]